MSILKTFFFGLLFLPVIFRLDNIQVKSSEAVLLKPEYEFKQTFVPKHNGLYLIKVFANNPKLDYKESLLFKLTNEDTKETIAEIPFSGLNVGVNTWVRFQVLPQKSSGKKYSFYLAAPSKTKKGIYIELAKAVNNSKDNDLTFFLNGEKQNGTLLFKSYYKVGTWQFINDSFTDFWQRINFDKPFLIAYISIILLLSSITFYVFLIK